jgi:membrane protease YdiL (CAAX protease family)
MQHFVGYVAASLLFALIHFRYVKKPLLLATVLLFSFCLGWLYIRTGSLAAPVIAHFIINALPALIYKWNGNSGNGQRNPGRE